jgi:hypothetical protein
MKDELKPRRQRRCAESREGHTFPDDKPFGVCTKCELEIKPPEHPSLRQK